MLGLSRGTVSVTYQGYSYAARMPWDPDQYGVFAEPRTRPGRDLLQSFDSDSPRLVVDLGCGTGRLTAMLAERWPSARVVGVDSSDSMLAKATALDTDVTWMKADIGAWEPDDEVDVMFSNAALHWLDDHHRLFPRLTAFLSSNSVLAIQMPDNHREASHRVAFQLASKPSWAPRLLPLVRREPVLSAVEYARLLEDSFDTVDIWRTTYLHLLEGEHAVSDWVRGSFLKPFLDALDHEAGTAFLAEYRALIRPVYECLPDGRTLFPFTRLFIVGRRRAYSV